MKKLDKIISLRRTIAVHYGRSLTDQALVVPGQNSAVSSSYHLYPIRVDSTSPSPGQIDVIRRLIDAGLGVNHHYIPVYRHPCYESFGFRRGY